MTPLPQSDAQPARAPRAGDGSGDPSTVLRAALACVLLAIVAWAPRAFRAGWSYDDAEAIRSNPVVEGALPVREAFVRDYWEHLGRAGHYRPVAVLTLRLDRALYGERAWGFRLTNVALHAAVVALAALLLILLGGRGASGFPWFGLGLFAAHPALADSVAWISGRTSMLSALGPLAAAVWIAQLAMPWRTLTWSRSAQAVLAPALGLLFSQLAKEDAFVLAPLAILAGATHSRRMAALVALGCALGLCAYFALRSGVYGSWLPQAPHAPLRDEPLLERSLVGGRAVLEALRLLAAPLGYPPNYERHPGFSTATGGLPLLGALGWLAWTSLVAFGARALRRRAAAPLAVAALVTALAALPWMQVLPAGVVFAPRLAYLPLLAAVPLVSAASRLALGSREVHVGVVLLGVCCALSWERAGVYESRRSYWTEQERRAPHDPRAPNELGLAHEERDELDAARACYERAIAMDPSYGRPWSNLGRLELQRGELAAAELALRRATELGPGNAVAWNNLGSVLLRRGRHDEALAAYEQAVRRAGGLASAWRGRARALLELSQPEAALASVRRARALDPSDALARSLEQQIERALTRAPGD